jgi:hypothetical protein
MFRTGINYDFPGLSLESLLASVGSELPGMVFHKVAIVNVHKVHTDQDLHAGLVDELRLVWQHPCYILWVRLHLAQRLKIVHPEFGRAVEVHDLDACIGNIAVLLGRMELLHDRVSIKVRGEHRTRRSYLRISHIAMLEMKGAGNCDAASAFSSRRVEVLFTHLLDVRKPSAG